MKKLLLTAGLSALLLSACGSPAVPSQTQPPPTTPTTPTSPIPSAPPADAPPDATISKEFLFSKRESRVVMQSLNLQPLDTVDLGNRLRVVLSVTRAQSGKNIGQKRASAVFIWGNQTVNLSGNYILGLGKTGEMGTLAAYNGKMNLAVSYPDYQAKTTKNTPYSAELGELCARLTFNLKAAGNVWSSNTPVEVCEGPATRAQEEAQVSKAAAKVLYTHQSLAKSRVTFTRLSTQASAAPKPADVLNMLSLSATKITVQSTFDLLSPYYMSGAMSYDDALRWDRLVRVMNRLYRDVNVYRIRLSDERERIMLLGWNSFGVAGVQFMRFHAPDGSSDPPDPAYGQAQTYPAIWRDAGSVAGQIQIGPHDPSATISGKYAVRSGTICAAGVGVTLDKNLQYDFTFPVGNNGLTSSQFTIEAMPDEGQDVIVDYALTIAFNGQSKTYTGFMCDILTPPPPPPAPSVNGVRVGMWFEHCSCLITEEGRHEVANIWVDRFDGPTPWPYPEGSPGTHTASGTYRVENAPECGAAALQVLASGPLQFRMYDDIEFVSYGLELPTSAIYDVTPHSRLVYSITLTGKDGPRVIDEAKCITWEN